MDNANYALAKYLAGKGAEVHLVTHRAWPDLVDMPQLMIHPVWRPLRSHLAGMPLLDRAGRRWARRLGNVNVVVNGGNCGWHDLTWVHYVHAAYQPESAAGSALSRLKSRIMRSYALATEKRTLKSARLVVCNSWRTFRDVTEHLGVQESRAQVVYYGTAPDRFRPSTPSEKNHARARLGWKNDRPVIVFVGALSDRRKGFDALFTAWQSLCRRPKWDCDLVVVGAGAQLSAWRERAREAGLSERIHFLGFRKDVPEILAACDALVHPARYEAYGLGVHEALCRGIPALVSAQAGVAERFPPELHDCLITDPENPTALADCLLHWRANLERCQASVIPFSNSLRSYTWDHMAERIVQLAQAA
jgi:glycosyltransferase involved in cell wall biosynthesis